MNRFSQFLPLVRCYLYAAVRGRAVRVPKGTARIGVMQLSKLGDMVCTTPVFRALKSAGHEVVVIGSALNGELLAGHPSVTEYAVWRKADIRALGLDAIVLTSPSAEAIAAAYLAGVAAIICPRIENGWSPYETRAYKLLRFLCLAAPHRMGHYAPQEYLNMLSALGIATQDTKKSLAVSAQAKAAVDAMLAPYPHSLKIAIAPGAGNKIKEWPPQRFNEVAQALAARGALVVVVGGPADKDLARIVEKGLPEGSVLNAAGELSIEETKVLIARMSLFIAADTGPVYIAEAFDVPTVDIVGPVDEREQPPDYPPRHVLVVPKRMESQIHIMNSRVYDTAEARRQAEGSSVAEVLAVIDVALGA